MIKEKWKPRVYFTNTTYQRLFANKEKTSGPRQGRRLGPEKLMLVFPFSCVVFAFYQLKKLFLFERSHSIRNDTILLKSKNTFKISEEIIFKKVETACSKLFLMSGPWWKKLFPMVALNSLTFVYYVQPLKKRKTSILDHLLLLIFKINSIFQMSPRQIVTFLEVFSQMQ